MLSEDTTVQFIAAYCVASIGERCLVLELNAACNGKAIEFHNNSTSPHV